MQKHLLYVDFTWMLSKWRLFNFLIGFLSFMRYMLFQEVMKNIEEQNLIFSAFLFQQQL